MSRERIEYLIRRLEGNNARAFARRCGIDPSSLSRVRSGKYNPEGYYQRILEAYPQVSPKWLTKGVGAAIPEDDEKPEVIARLDALEREVRALRKAIEKLTKVSHQ